MHCSAHGSAVCGAAVRYLGPADNETWWLCTALHSELYYIVQLAARLPPKRCPCLGILAGASVTILAARQPGDTAAPRLKLKKQADGTLEITLRDAEEAAAATASAKAAAQPGGVVPGALAPQAWAWPLPLVGLGDWVPYESLLRSILAAHPLNLNKGLQQGLALRLTKSSIKVGVHEQAHDIRGGFETTFPKIRVHVECQAPLLSGWQECRLARHEAASDADWADASTSAVCHGTILRCWYSVSLYCCVAWSEVDSSNSAPMQQCFHAACASVRPCSVAGCESDPFRHGAEDACRH